MRVVVVSDSHGNIVRLKHVLGFVDKVGASALVHCGDWDTVETARVMRGVSIPSYAVLGNADEAHSREILGELESAKVNVGEVDKVMFKLGGKNLAVGHQPGKLTSEISSGEFDVVFHGHTHRVKDRMVGGTRVINPGALGNTDKPSFAVYDIDSDKVEFINIQA